MVSHPWVFDRVQSLLGYKRICRCLVPYFKQTENHLVLDIGAGTGTLAPLLPRSTTYLWLDNDPQKLAGFKTKGPSGFAILGDATYICLKDRGVDYALCVHLAHHLSNTQLRLLLSELARVVKRKLIFFDALEYKGAKISNLLWKFDRGSYPRSTEVLLSAMEPWFHIEQMEHLAIYHHYVLLVGIPRHSVQSPEGLG